MVRIVMGLSALLAFAGCGDKEQEEIIFSTDTRIDMAGDPDPDSGDTRMCVNDNGEIFVVWVDDRDGSPDVWFNRSVDLGVSWLPAAVKINRGDSNVWLPDIACSTTGVFVVWEDDRDGELENHQIYFSRSMTAGETWLDADRLLELDFEGRSMSLGPEIIAVGEDLYVTWFDNANGAFDIFVASSGDNGESWRDPVRADSDEPAGSAYSAWPQIGATEAGKVYVVWEDSRNGASDIYFARSENAGSSFKEDTRLDGGDAAGLNASFAPRLSADGDEVYVVWHDERNGEGRDVFVNHSFNGGADWNNNAGRIDTDNPGFFNSLFPTVETVGNVGHVAWQDARSEGYDIYYRRYQSGDPVGEEIRLDVGDEEGFSNSLNTAISAQDQTLVVAWEDGRGEVDTDFGYNDLYYNYSEAPSEFGSADLRIDSIAPGESFKVDLDVHVYGKLVYSTWTDGRLGTADVYFKALEVGQESDYDEQAADDQGSGTQ